MKLEINPKAKALIFDLDGTLSDSVPAHIASWNSVCEKLSCTFDERIQLEMTGMPTICFAERIKREQKLKIDVKELVRMEEQEFGQNINQIKPQDMIVDLVKKAYGKIPMAVGTGASRTTAILQLKILKIDHFFNFIITADDVFRHKPDSETFLKCAKLMDTQPQYCQVFEDGEMGMHAARTAGMMLTDVRHFLNDSFSDTSFIFRLPKLLITIL